MSGERLGERNWSALRWALASTPVLERKTGHTAQNVTQTQGRTLSVADLTALAISCCDLVWDGYEDSEMGSGSLNGTSRGHNSKRSLSS